MYREGVSRVKYQKYDNSKVSIPLYKYYGQLEYARSAIENKQIHFEIRILIMIFLIVL